MDEERLNAFSYLPIILLYVKKKKHRLALRPHAPIRLAPSRPHHFNIPILVESLNILHALNHGVGEVNILDPFLKRDNGSVPNWIEAFCADSPSLLTI